MLGHRLPSLYRAPSKSRNGFFMLKISPPEASLRKAKRERRGFEFRDKRSP